MLFGTLSIWVALLAAAASMGLYLTASLRRATDADGGAAWAKAGRGAFFVSVGGIFSAAATLGTLLVTHRFDVSYVYEHSARGMAPLYWFPSFWAGQEGSFLLWGFWVSILGIVLTLTSGPSERRVMPVYTGLLLFLATMLAVRSPFVPLNTQGLLMPTEGLGLNPNLENYWMVIHPPTLFLGFAALTVPFAFALAALFWKDWDGWLRRALPWGLFGFAVLGLAMMMGGYWAYEMLGWGGFWAWDPVENGPLVPWLLLIGFLHAAQIQRVRGGFGGPTLLFALLPFVGVLYESFLTRSGVLTDFSVHSFSELGGFANDMLLGILVIATAVSVGTLLWRAKSISTKTNAEGAILDAPASREFGYLMAMAVLTLCAIITAVGMSAPLLTGIAVKLHLATHTSNVKEVFFNRANFPIGVLLMIGMGIGPHLAWRGRGTADVKKLNLCYFLAVLSAFVFVGASFFVKTNLPGPKLAPQLILFTASIFAILSNGALLLPRFAPKRSAPLTIGGFVSHIGAALLLIGVVCLVTFTKRDPSVQLTKGISQRILNGRYRMTYLGQSSDYQTDKNNALKFAVASNDGKERFTALMPFALRSVEGNGPKQIFGHPAIAHHLDGDLYLALKDGPDEFYPNGIFQMDGDIMHAHKPKLPLGGTQAIGDYTLRFVKFAPDPQARDQMRAFRNNAGPPPTVFPVAATVEVSYKGQTVTVSPQNISHYSPDGKPLNQSPDSPEVKLPGGWLLSFTKMDAGSADASNPNAGAAFEGGSFMLRPPGPLVETFIVEATTRPMISLVWIGTLFIFAGGLISMRRRIVENRASPIPDLPALAPPVTQARRTRRRTAKPQTRTAPSLALEGRKAAHAPASAAKK